MEDYHTSSSGFAQSSTMAGRDSDGLLVGTKAPVVMVTTATEEEFGLRARRNSADISYPDQEPLHERSRMVENPEHTPASRTRKQVPGPSRATGLLQRLTTIRAPISSPHLSRRAQGQSYDSLDDGDYDHVAVDLSSFGGYELTMMPNRKPQNFQQPTEYVSPRVESGADDQSNIARQRSRLGTGLVIGAELRREAQNEVLNTYDHNPSSGQLLPTSAMERAKTMRKAQNLAQNLAQEHHMIVAVNEGNERVDLSILEGGQLNHSASHQSLEAMAMRSRTLDEVPKSYFFPSDPDIPNWRPFSMRSFYILFLASVSLGLAIFQELFYRRSVALLKENKGILQFDKVSEVSTWNFFAWKYLPTMITIVYAVLFSIMDFDIRRLEPYYQLSQPHGAQAAASLNLDHLTMFQYFVPFKAAKLKQWPVFFSTVGNIIASTVAPSIQNPSITFASNPNCPDGNPCPAGQRHFFVLVSARWSRALSAVLIIVAAIAVILFWMLRRKSGLLSDPKGIAGIASMATKSHILADFQGLDLATRGEIHKRLAQRRFILYKSSIWQGEWIQSSEKVHESEHRLGSPHPMMLRLSAGIPMLSFMVFGLVGVPLIALTSARVIPNVVPWLPILLATLLKLFFTTFESDVRMMEPFYQLSRGNAPSQDSLTLDYQGTIYGWIIVKALINGHSLVSLVGFSSLLLDVLAVTVSSFSVSSQIFLHRDIHDSSNQDETYVSFWASLGLSVGILLFVILTTCLVYHRRRHPFLPREPSTIAAILAFIYASNMLDDFFDTERLSNKEMEDRLKKLGKRYALGWFKGRDGRLHCAIDEEPMRSKYVHGKPYTKAQAPWMQMGTEDFFA